MTTFAIVCRDPEPARQHHIARQAEMLVMAGHTVDLYAPHQLTFAELPRGTRLHVHTLPQAPPPASIIRSFLFWLQAFLVMTLGQLRHRYHVIQVVAPVGPFVLTTWLAQRFGARVVLSVTATLPEQIMAARGIPRHHLHVRLAAFGEELAVDNVDHLIAPSEPMRTRLISRGCATEKISVVYEAPDETLYGKKLSVVRHATVRDRFLITCLGSPDTPLDLATPIGALALVVKQVPQALLWILCLPEQQAMVEERVRQEGIAPHVIVQAMLPEAELPAFIAQADVHIVAVGRDPLHDLVLPTGVMASIMLGVPTVSTRTIATQYYFDARVLLSYDLGDARDLAERLEWLAQHPETRAAMSQQGSEHLTQVVWSRERQRYLGLLSSIAAVDSLRTLEQGVLANRPRLLPQRRAPVRAYRARLAKAASLLPDDSQVEASDSASDDLPLRISPPPQAWRQRQQWRLRIGSWLLRTTATLLLFGIPIFGAINAGWAKVIAALMFGSVTGVMLILPSGEAAIIVALYFIAQRSLFLQYPPEGRLGPIFLYLGTALQLIIFIGFVVRTIIQQRPLLRSGFILWPASVYLAISLLSAFVNHVPLNVMVLGIEHTLHNLIFVVLIAEDLPSPRQLRVYVGFVIVAISALATIAILQTAIAHGLLPQAMRALPFLDYSVMPAAVIVPDADTFGYLLNFGIFLALGAFVSLNIGESRYEIEEHGPTRLNIFLLAAIGWLTLAQIFTSSIENWIGLVVGVIALAIILRGTLRWVIVIYLALVLALSAVPFQATPQEPATSAVQDTVGILAGAWPHNAPLMQSLRVASDHWLLGVGPGRFGGTVAYLTNSPIYEQYGFQRTRSITSINLFWLHILGEVGILGLAAFLWLMVQATIAVWRAHRHGAHQQWWGISAGVFGMIFAMSVATFFGNALEVDSLSAPFWALVGIAVALPVANRPLVALPPVRFQSEEGATNPEMPPVREAPTRAREGVSR